MTSHEHDPVLVGEVLSFLNPRPNTNFVDATVGMAGHATAILNLTAPNGRLLGIDADRQAIDSARVSLLAFAGRVTLVRGYFDSIGATARSHGFEAVDGALFDLGVSSPQIDVPERGFSFQSSGPLDMRMDEEAGRTAAEILASEDEKSLARIFSDYGEERYALRIARRIVEQRAHGPITTTDQLAGLVARTVPTREARINPATRIFQALRIAVNDELSRLRSALASTVSLLGHGGRLVVISFHSLEDRIVKQFMRDESRDCICQPETPTCACGHQASLRVLTKKPVRASEAETRRNPRSRSAKLRAAEAL